LTRSDFLARLGRQTRSLERLARQVSVSASDVLLDAGVPLRDAISLHFWSSDQTPDLLDQGAFDLVADANDTVSIDPCELISSRIGVLRIADRPLSPSVCRKLRVADCDAKALDHSAPDLMPDAFYAFVVHDALHLLTRF
jgi:hypothetical protein